MTVLYITSIIQSGKCCFFRISVYAAQISLFYLQCTKLIQGKKTINRGTTNLQMCYDSTKDLSVKHFEDYNYNGRVTKKKKEQIRSESVLFQVKMKAANKRKRWTEILKGTAKPVNNYCYFLDGGKEGSLRGSQTGTALLFSLRLSCWRYYYTIRAWCRDCSPIITTNMFHGY